MSLGKECPSAACSRAIEHRLTEVETMTKRMREDFQSVNDKLDKVNQNLHTVKWCAVIISLFYVLEKFGLTETVKMLLAKV